MVETFSHRTNEVIMTRSNAGINIVKIRHPKIGAIVKDNVTNALSTLKDEKYFASLKYLYSGIIQMIGSKGFKVIGGGRYA